MVTGSSTLLVVSVAFAAWWTFATDADAGWVVSLAGLAALTLVAVPALAASATDSLRPARIAYIAGAVLALAELVAGFSQAFEADAPEGASSDAALRVDAWVAARQARPASGWHA